MKTPAFWKQETMHGRLLAPLGWIYYGISRLHRGWQSWRSKPTKLKAPIICVGNATAGGAGKTPTVRMLANMLKIAGSQPSIISRGYGGEPQKKPLKVNPKKHRAEQVGDEPLLLAKSCSCWISSSRQNAARYAIDEGADIILADDGLQNPTFHKDVSLLVMDSDYGAGNEQLIPSGPLREPLAKAFSRSHGLILIGDGNYQPPTTKPIWKARLEVMTDLSAYRGTPVIAFAGIAHPDKFFATLKAHGITPQEEIAFGDHQPFNATELALLMEKAEEQDATLLTTAKDYVRLPESAREQCAVVDVKLQLEKPQEFLKWLQEQLAYGETHSMA